MGNSKLFAPYGTNFRYVGEIKNSLDRVSVVTSIPIPRFRDIQTNPTHVRNCALDFCSNSELFSNDFSKIVNDWSVKVIPYIEHLKKKEKYYMERLDDVLEEHLYAALPKLKLHASTKVRHRFRWCLGATLLSAMLDLITLTVESISPFIKMKQEHRMNKNVVGMGEDQASIAAVCECLPYVWWIQC